MDIRAIGSSAARTGGRDASTVRALTIVYGTTVIETKVTNDTEGHEAVSGVALSFDVAATSS